MEALENVHIYKPLARHNRLGRIHCEKHVGREVFKEKKVFITAVEILDQLPYKNTKGTNSHRSPYSPLNPILLRVGLTL